MSMSFNFKFVFLAHRTCTCFLLIDADSDFQSSMPISEDGSLIHFSSGSSNFAVSMGNFIFNFDVLSVFLLIDTVSDFNFFRIRRSDALDVISK
jgi:ADP-glucose pyrophosphorylase